LPPAGAALLAVAEALGALFACLLLSVGAVLVIVVLLVSPRFDAELEIEAVRDDATPVGQLLSGLQSLSLASSVESVDDGATRQLVFSGLDSRDFPDVAVIDLLTASGYRVGEHRVWISTDMQRLIRTVGVPYFTAQALIFLGVGWMLMRLRVRPSVAAPQGGSLLAVGWGAAAGTGAFLISATLAMLLSWIGFPVEEQDWLIDLLGDRAQLTRLAPWIVLILPFSEEVFFRGYVFRMLSQRAGPAIGYLVSAGLFAAVHLNPSGFLVYAAIGFVLAWVYRRTGSLVAPVVGHVVHNGIIIVVALLGAG
jgi:membrane protease YdiL (CAAX protease family)